MSIPKEPRQLMINLMYLVLLALLALNVSAEILNAFFTIDRGLTESSRLTADSNSRLMRAIHQQADAYVQFDSLRQKALRAQEITQQLSQYLNDIRAQIVEAAGGLDDDQSPKRKTDKDIPTRLLVNEGKGEALKNQILKARAQLLALIDDPNLRANLANNLPLQIKSIPEGSDKKTWAQYTFQQMPVAAVLPIFSKWQNDAKAAESLFLNHFLEQMGLKEVKIDKYIPILSANNAYVIRGEEFKGEIVLGAYSSTADNIIVEVDGRNYPVEKGKAIFSARPNTMGKKTHTMTIHLDNPITKERQSFQKQFSYVVGERSVTVSADKMNVLYMGVENPLSIVAAGVPSGDVRITVDGINLTRGNNGKYIATAKQTGIAKITVSGGGLEPTTFKYRVKSIPDPVMKLGGRHKGGNIRLGEFKAQLGIIALLENFDFEARCKVDEFEIVRIPKGGDAIRTTNSGGRFGNRAKQIIQGARRGDLFYFGDIKVKCPGDRVRRTMNSLVFNIK